MKKIIYALVLLVLCGGMLKAAIPAAERNALIALYNSTNGDAWTDNSNWKTNGAFSPVGTEGTWFGVTVVADHVTSLDLSWNNLSGTIPVALQSLTYLQVLCFFSNNLTGTIPSQLGTLKKLLDLNLGYNQLSGAIPIGLGSLVNLNFLVFRGNELSGAVPTQFGSLVNLNFLDLSFNKLSGGIPTQLGLLTKLEELQLTGNQLSNAIPVQLCNLKKLKALTLGFNKLSGAIPLGLANLTLLEYLELYANQLSGTIPRQLGNLAMLKSLFLSLNQLTGTIPLELGKLVYLEMLDLCSNQLNGGIPVELGNLAMLLELGLSNNQLTGAIPIELGNLAMLEYLDLSSNQLTGAIPAALGQLNRLTFLNCGQNQLSSVLPPELASLHNLETLWLWWNQLSGNIPPEISQMINLRSLMLDHNQLSGFIPPELGSMTNLVQIGLFNNQLSGSIPPEIGDMINLNEIWLWNNNLSGTIPIELTQLINLVDFDISMNKFSGSIPPELGSLANLQFLSLWTNQLSGTIPPEIGSLSKLQVLYLDDNHFNGAIPPELGNLTSLQVLWLSSNNLVSSIPVTLTNLSNLSNTSTNIGFNALYSNDAGLTAFLNEKDADWANTQTVAPLNVRAWVAGPNSIELTWSPIAYVDDSGGYNVFYSTVAGGPYTLYGTTAAKSDFSMAVNGLSTGVPYYFVLQSQTNPNVHNSNLLFSEYSQQVTATCQSGNAPVITVQPENKSIHSGQTATLTVTATGDTPLHYQWFLGTSGNTTNPVGSDAADFTTPALTVTTSYWVRVYNDSGLANSNTATVIVSNGVIAPADFNIDGVTDLLWRHYAEDGANSIWLMQGVATTGADQPDGQFTDMPDEAVVPESKVTEAARDDNAPMESIWGTSPQPGPLPEGGYSAINLMEEVPLPALPDTRWLMCGSDDFNGDGKPDIVWRFNGPGGAVAVWLMDGVNRIGVLDLPAESTLKWQIVSINDIDGDGKTDIVWQGTEDKAYIYVKAWLMDGSQLREQKVIGKLIYNSTAIPYKVVGCGDFDNDGVQDILWRIYATGGKNAVWLMKPNFGGIKHIIFLTAVPDLTWQIAGVGDFNKDGKLDIIWRHNGGGGDNRVWIMNGTTYVRNETMPAVTDLTWKIEN